MQQNTISGEDIFKTHTGFKNIFNFWTTYFLHVQNKLDQPKKRFVPDPNNFLDLKKNKALVRSSNAGFGQKVDFNTKIMHSGNVLW